jgi:Fe-S-cluster-containing dehydrogenase component/formate-dependent nitrite reductase membrane component NrfD
VPTYAWVIDQTTCIGCHACTTACKSENDVPLGVNRTWVKYVETGTFPRTRRQMAVLRCNHCEKPPCVAICPTSAMFKRPDGIVDFDVSRCIGCKACIQACPYDAIYIDPEEHVAEKCNFCSHRVDAGLLPACVVVCPTESLVFGDLDDPDSRAARVIASRPTHVRRPEQGTSPKAFYVGASDAVLDPLAPIHTEAYMWSDRLTGGAKDHTADGHRAWSPEPGRRQLAVLPVVPAGPPGAMALGSVRGPLAPAPAAAPAAPVASPAVSSDRPVEVSPSTSVRPPRPRVAYDVFHPRPWGLPVAMYLWTKGIGAGAFSLLFLAIALGLAEVSQAARLAVAFVSLAGLGLTALLLAGDLKRPERFWTILVRAQPRSWLAIGAFILVGYSGLLGLWFLGTLAGIDQALLAALGWPTVLLAAATALYTMFLFGQCEARDLWQNPMTGVVLLAQATILGSASVLAVGAVLETDAALIEFARIALVVGGLANAGALVLGEALVSHPTTNGRAAAHLLVRGPWWWGFWVGGVLLAGVLPVVAGVANPSIGAVAATAIVAAMGLLWYETAFVAAGQAVPIS